MKNEKHIAYTAPSLTRIAIETACVLLASGGAEAPRGAHARADSKTE